MQLPCPRYQIMWKYFKAVFKVGFRLLFAWLFEFIPMGNHPERHSKEKRFKIVKRNINAIIKCFKADLKIENKEIFDEATSGDRKCLFVGNHTSFTDGLTILTLFDTPATFVAKKEASKMFMVGSVTKMIDAYLMDRSDLRQSLKVIRQVQNDLRDKKHHVIIFPEGTRNKDVNAPMLPFHPGSFKGATGVKADIVLFASFGNHRILDKHSDDKRELVQYRFIRKITYEEYKDMDTVELSDMCHREIQKAVDELRAYDKEFYEKGLGKISLRKGEVRL